MKGVSLLPSRAGRTLNSAGLTDGCGGQLLRGMPAAATGRCHGRGRREKACMLALQACNGEKGGALCGLCERRKGGGLPAPGPGQPTGRLVGPLMDSQCMKDHCSAPPALACGAWRASAGQPSRHARGLCRVLQALNYSLRSL